MANSATTLIDSATSSVASSVSEFASSLATAFKSVGDIQIPLPNVLHDYASYDYILGIAVLSDADLQNPNRYMSYKGLKLICKSANADPSNRVKTDYGTFDFFIDNLVIDAVIGHERGNVTNSTNISFTINEPYSMGVFPIACQQAAWEAGHQNWRVAPFVLTIEFRGNDELGVMSLIPTTTRFIPFRFINLSMNVNQDGAVYQVTGMIWNDQGHSVRNSTLKTDVSVKGSTVQEVLQTGEKSLQAVWNKRLQQLKTDKIVDVPDEIIILFPTSITTSEEDSGGGGSDSATTGSAADSKTIYTNLGTTTKEVVVDADNNKIQIQVQDIKDVNLIGKAKIGVGTNKFASAPYGNDNAVYNPDLKVNVRAENTPKLDESDFRFRQDTSLTNAINQVLLQSDYPKGAFNPDSLSEEGYVKWWRIDIQVYNVSTDATYSQTGRKPTIIVYRIIPYNVHNSSAPLGTNQPAVGFAELRKKTVKEYNYLYTGKNVDVISFEIKLENGFAATMGADAGKRSQDIRTAKENDAEEPKANTLALKGAKPQKTGHPAVIDYGGLLTNSEQLGGGPADTIETRAARIFHDNITRGSDMLMLDMEIVGDPFFIAQSGTGTYTATQSQYQSLNTDGTVNYQTGEVNVIVNFRTPIDINQDTGLYQFAPEVPSSPLLLYSGLFRLNTLTSSFKNGSFTQRLHGNRLPGQENTSEPSKDGLFNLGQVTKDGLAAIGGFFGI
jgi:hypothetical protein